MTVDYCIVKCVAGAGLSKAKEALEFHSRLTPTQVALTTSHDDNRRDAVPQGIAMSMSAAYILQHRPTRHFAAVV